MLRAVPLFALVALATASCSSPKGPSLAAIAPAVNATLRTGEDLIEPGDVLQVRVVVTETAPVGRRLAPGTLDQDVRVQPDGRASFVGVDGIDVAGLLPSMLEELLGARYAETFDADLLLHVGIAERAARSVTVFGEVARPGSVAVPPTGKLTLVEALGRAGGPRTRSAWLSNVRLVRWDASSQRQVSWTIDARQKHWGATETVVLQSGDLVFVPNTNVDRVSTALDNYVRRMFPLPYLAPPAD